MSRWFGQRRRRESLITTGQRPLTLGSLVFGAKKPFPVAIRVFQPRQRSPSYSQPVEQKSNVRGRTNQP